MSPKQQKILLGVVAALVLSQAYTLWKLGEVDDYAVAAEYIGRHAESRAINAENRMNGVVRDVNQLKLQVLQLK